MVCVHDNFGIIITSTSRTVEFNEPAFRVDPGTFAVTKFDTGFASAACEFNDEGSILYLGSATPVKTYPEVVAFSPQLQEVQRWEIETAAYVNILATASNGKTYFDVSKGS